MIKGILIRSLSLLSLMNKVCGLLVWSMVRETADAKLFEYGKTEIKITIELNHLLDEFTCLERRDIEIEPPRIY